MLTKKIPFAPCCYSKPHLSIWHTQGKVLPGGGGEMGEGVVSEEISQMFACVNSFPLHSLFLLTPASLASVFPPPSLSLLKRQTTPSNLISLATCKEAALTPAGHWSSSRRCADTKPPRSTVSWLVFSTKHPDF